MWIVLVFFAMATASIYLLYYELYGHSATKYWDLPAGEAVQVVHTAPTRKFNEYDYWDGEDIDYDTGEIGSNARPGVRYPKNRDRAYSGSVERFHDGGW